MQQEFINMAAHELGLVELLSKEELQETDSHYMLDVLSRNAKRLQRLADDLLDVTRIESQAMKLNREKINLIVLVSDIIEEYK